MVIKKSLAQQSYFLQSRRWSDSTCRARTALRTRYGKRRGQQKALVIDGERSATLVNAGGGSAAELAGESGKERTEGRSREEAIKKEEAEGREVHTRKRARTPDERHGEEEGGQGPPTPRLHLADKTGRRSTLGQWIQREGGPPEASQKKRVALAGSRTAASDGAGAPPQPGTCEGREIIDRVEREKGLSESKRGEGNTTGKGGIEEQLTTTKRNDGYGT